MGAARLAVAVGGISVFYGASDADTALIEVSAHNTKQHAVVGEFRPARNILVIDMTALPELPSVFEEDTAQRYDRVVFLRRFAEDIVLPIELDASTSTTCRRRCSRSTCATRFPDAVQTAWCSAAHGPEATYVLFCGPESVTAHGNQGDDAVLMIDPAAMIGYRLGRKPTTDI